MFNKWKDYSRLSFRLFFKNKLISSIVLMILLVVSIFTITVMNIFFGYSEIGKKTIEETYNSYEKRMEFCLNGDSFSAENIAFLSAKAKEWGYNKKLNSSDAVKLNEEYYNICFTNQYVNGYVVTDGKSVQDNYQNTQYIWLSDMLKDRYSIGDKITVDIDQEREFTVAGFCEGKQVVVNAVFMDTSSVFFYDDFHSVKNYAEIKKLYDQVSSKDLKVQMGIDKMAQTQGMSLDNYATFDILAGSILSSYLMGRWTVLAVTVMISVILLGISAGVIQNYFHIYKEKNIHTLRMYSTLGLKDRGLGYVFVMPLAVSSIAIGGIALGISALICLIIQPVVLQFVFEKVFITYSNSLFMVSPAPFFINLVVLLLFVMISFVMSFKTALSSKKVF